MKSFISLRIGRRDMSNEALLRTGARPGFRRRSRVKSNDILAFDEKCQAPVAELGR
jgi:hypothetical protein